MFERALCVCVCRRCLRAGRGARRSRGAGVARERERERGFFLSFHSLPRPLSRSSACLLRDDSPRGTPPPLFLQECLRGTGRVKSLAARHESMGDAAAQGGDDPRTPRQGRDSQPVRSIVSELEDAIQDARRRKAQMRAFAESHFCSRVKTRSFVSSSSRGGCARIILERRDPAREREREKDSV